jgi:hypothetical protein
VFIVWGDFERTPGSVDPQRTADLALVLQLASAHNLWVCLSVFVGWMSGRLFWPSWKGDRNLYTDSVMVERSEAFAAAIATVAARFSERLIALEYGNEMDCCTDRANASAVVAWTRRIYAAFKRAAPGVLVVPGTDEGLVFDAVSSASWPIGGGPWRWPGNASTRRIAADLLDAHPYPFFSPYKGSGLLDTLSQASLSYDVRFLRAFGPVFVQEFGTLFTAGLHEQDSFLRATLPRAWAGGANGFLWWCMRDIRATSAPYDVTCASASLQTPHRARS